MVHGSIAMINPLTGIPYYGGIDGVHYIATTHHSVGMAFSLTTRSLAEPAHVFGWKTADPSQPAPDPVTGGWIDDAVASAHPTWPLAIWPYPPFYWYEMRYGSILDGTSYGGLLGYHYGTGINDNSVKMSFIIDSTPRLKITKLPGISPNDAVLIPTIDPNIPFEIWYNYNMVDLDDATWNLLGSYPAGTLSIIDPGVMGNGTPPPRKFYILKE